MPREMTHPFLSDRKTLERLARMYSSTNQASRAVRVSSKSLLNAWKRFGISPPDGTDEPGSVSAHQARRRASRSERLSCWKWTPKHSPPKRKPEALKRGRTPSVLEFQDDGPLRGDARMAELGLSAFGDLVHSTPTPFDCVSHSLFQVGSGSPREVAQAGGGRIHLRLFRKVIY